MSLAIAAIPLLAIVSASSHATPPSSRVASPVHAAFQGSHPLGATVLYDQTNAEVSYVVAQIFPDQHPLDAEIADDFTITDAAGWTVTSVVALQNASLALDVSSATFNVNIFPDNNGVPGDIAECALTGIVPVFSETDTVATLPIGSNCFLAAGTWWLSATPVLSHQQGGQLFASLGDTGSAFGAQVMWRNPNGGWGGACPTWTSIFSCADLIGNDFTVTDDLRFQVIGQTGGTPGDVVMTVGLAEATDDPALCGTATALSATAGDRINFCYTITNTLPFAMNFQSLEDTVIGAIFTDQPITVAAGTSYQFNRTITTIASQSPTSTWTSTDSLPNFVSTTGAYNYVEISATGDVVPAGNTDDGVSNVTMPFSFDFGNATSDLLCVSNNGIIVFGGSGICDNSLWHNNPIPWVDATRFVAPFWMDINSGGNIFSQALGDAPNRQFVVEYSDKNTWGGSPTPGYTFEVIFNEDGTIDYNYATVTSGGNPAADGGALATIGVQSNATTANQYSYETVSVSDGQNIHWTPSVVFMRRSLASVTLDVGAPIIYAVPTPIAGSAAAGEAASTLLFLTNTGNRDLFWTLEEALPASHFPLYPDFARLFAVPTPASAGLPPQSALIGKPTMAPTPASVSASTAVPTFGIAYYGAPQGPTYVDFDTASPDVLDPIAQFPSATVISAGAFVDEDYTKEYVIDDTGRDLYTIDTGTGALTLVGNTGITGDGNIVAMRWDSITGNTYVMRADCGTSSTLYVIDLTTGATNLVGAYTANGSGSCVVGVAIDAAGLMYGVDIWWDDLVALDKTTGAGASIGPLGFNGNYVQGLDFDLSSGTLYGIGYNGDTSLVIVYTVDVTTGQATVVAPVVDNLFVLAFAIAVAQPACNHPADIPWLTPDAISGTATPGDFSTVTLGLDAAALVPGVYDATLCVHSNDLHARTTQIPVEFTVTSADTTDVIFTNGFDGS